MGTVSNKRIGTLRLPELVTTQRTNIQKKNVILFSLSSLLVLPDLESLVVS